MNSATPNRVPGAMVSASLRLVAPLGAGGMGSVWIADHLTLRTQVVVKFMSDALVGNAEALARFSREAAAASQVKSPHVVQMLDYGVSPDGSPFIAMELLEGKTLSDLIARFGSLNADGVAKIVVQVGRALTRAHEKGIVHRDLKPDNIFLTDAGGGELFAKLLDFGVAKASLDEATRSTGAGQLVGTPVYMSPEQILAQKTLDYRSDLWSLGVVAFEALTGHVPFGGETVAAVSVAICAGDVPVPSQLNTEISPAVDAWFMRACAREPAARFGSAKEMGEALVAAVSAARGVANGLAADNSGAMRLSAEALVGPSTAPTPTRPTTNGASATSHAPVGAAPPPRRRVALIAAGAVGAIAVGVGGAVLFAGAGGSQRTEGGETPAKATAKAKAKAKEEAPKSSDEPANATRSKHVSERAEVPVDQATAAAAPSPSVDPSTVAPPTVVPATPPVMTPPKASVVVPPKPSAPPAPSASDDDSAKKKKKGSYVLE